MIFASGENLHEMSKHVFWKNKIKYFNMSSVENVTKNAKHSREWILLIDFPLFFYKGYNFRDFLFAFLNTLLSQNGLTPLKTKWTPSHYTY